MAQWTGSSDDFHKIWQKANSIALTFDISSTKIFLCIQSRLMIGNILLTELSVSSHLNVCISDIQVEDFELLWKGNSFRKEIHHSKQVRTVYLVAFQSLTSSLFIRSSDLFVSLMFLVTWKPLASTYHSFIIELVVTALP